MKRLSLLLVAVLAITFVTSRAVVRAETITLDDPDSSSSSALDADTATDTSSTTDSETKAATVPDTGFAPTENKVFTSSMVFLGGAALGGAIGFGIIQLRKKSQNY